MLITKQSETKWNNETYIFFFFYKPISVSKQMKRIRYIGKTLKQDETDQNIWNMLIMKQGEMKWNDETYIIFFLL